ncbi:MAG: glycosyltransferase family 1 protein [Prevotellaceae bacterium]|jgi:hypothetical protein|nr:glycosyltransferase family 1 protein [Prevotellaceae bacterium]
MTKSLNIVAFDIPYPANYGGVIDVFYRIKALSALGVKVTLHCFEYWRSRAPELDACCHKVYYYPRRQTLINQFRWKPYAVVSRKNSRLINNLLSNDDPILFEGLVCCYYLNDRRLRRRLKIFRECNIEHDYYRGLAAASNDLWQKFYYAIEAVKMQYYERILRAADVIVALSTTDQKHFERIFPTKTVKYIPCFHANEHISSQTGSSSFLLYHANLSLAENVHAALYLCHNIFGKLPYRCVIAGLNPVAKLRAAVSRYPNIELVPNPDDVRMQQLLREAHINLLITFQATGLKLKLLNTLFAGRHVIANRQMLSGADLDTLCHIADTSGKQLQLCHELMQKPFIQSDIDLRELLLIPQFSNQYLGEEFLKLF